MVISQKGARFFKKRNQAQWHWGVCEEASLEHRWKRQGKTSIFVVFC